MPLEDVAMRRELMHEVAKRPIDYSLLDIHVVHGVVYLRGIVRKLRGYDADPAQVAATAREWNLLAGREGDWFVSEHQIPEPMRAMKRDVLPQHR